jgi:hypothetical protein
VPYILILIIAVAYFVGWLPAPWCVALLLTLVLLTLNRRSTGPTRRRPGYIPVPRPVSASESPGMVERVQTYTGSSPSSGPAWEVRTAFTQPPDLSRITAHGFYGSGTGGNPGHPTMGADEAS